MAQKRAARGAAPSKEFDDQRISPADDTGNPFIDLFRAFADIPLVIFTGHSIYEPGDDR